ncbi:NADH dehydrogenase [ubiquinone] 1 beta subcomplex subunit 2, mitochondrial [Alligator mississippiensis]|uniref:NADH dehydrogenase [ubiquinone] 1 beta subcomplex subunit 2, mitochondrial n=1 Tax=Alligator mississippiensis TaxID=8496 RepID=UPI0003D0EA7A|nr:NADH dehydrogenase [ubiquinone] 1 beta subcomplex subunit 2, mitochondrial [Alligator mississippiensis]XP_059582451.1 NADH dehydrogenase [ubiquinone] 1 beta subcomplex subunit 2, mitochondrial [Alligator mississippiensis]
MLARLSRSAGALRSGTMAMAARRHAGHAAPRYRQFPEVTRRQVVLSELISGFMWFWILWHFWHSPDTLLGHFPYPDPAAWTDEELGIPPDDEE